VTENFLAHVFTECSTCGTLGTNGLTQVNMLMFMVKIQLLYFTAVLPIKSV